MRTQPLARLSTQPSPPDDMPFFRHGNGAGFERRWMDGGGTREEIEKFVQSYHDLPVDRYMSPERPYRYRRFGRFLYASDGTRLRTLPNAPFTQSAQFNRLAGGVVRYLEPLSPDVRRSRFLDTIIRELISLLPVYTTNWLVNVHQFRVVSSGEPVSPAPEGVHRDGHAFIALVAVDRVNISGGSNSVFDRNMNLLRKVNLFHRFDYLLLDDHRSYHGVSPVISLPYSPGCRDMLVIDLNFEDLVDNG